MKKCTINDFKKIQQFYWNAIDQLDNTSVAWIKGVYPSDAFIMESLDKGECYALYDKDNLVATVILNSEPNESYKKIHWNEDIDDKDILIPHALLVSPIFQHQGYGKKVVNEMIEIAKSMNKKVIRLDVLERNQNALNLYLACGFKVVEKCLMYYEDTGWTDFILMEYKL